MTTIHPAMLSFLQENVERGMLGGKNRLAFVCEVQPEELGLVIVDKSGDDLVIKLMEGDYAVNAVQYKGRTVTVAKAPFQSPRTWLTTLIEMEKEAGMAVKPTRAKVIKPPTDNLPTAPRKVAARKGRKVSKEALALPRKILLPRERIIKTLLRELNLVEAPTPAELFRIVDRRGNQKIALPRDRSDVR